MTSQNHTTKYRFRLQVTWQVSLTDSFSPPPPSVLCKGDDHSSGVINVRCPFVGRTSSSYMGVAILWSGCHNTPTPSRGTDSLPAWESGWPEKFRNSDEILQKICATTQNLSTDLEVQCYQLDCYGNAAKRQTAVPLIPGQIRSFTSRHIWLVSCFLLAYLFHWLNGQRFDRVCRWFWKAHIWTSSWTWSRWTRR